jgi:pimeloyl-ACP methyl ester carboxylesterase
MLYSSVDLWLIERMVAVATTTSRAATVAVVLVHGACHGAWCWEDVVPRLAERGWDVRTVELPLTGLYDDAAVVRDAVAQAKSDGCRVLLVGHSYAGFVISEGGHAADELVYCAASLPDPGDSATNQFSQITTPELDVAVVNSEDGTLLSLHPERAVPAFYNLCTPEQVAAALARVRPMHVAALDEVAHEPVAWRQVRSSYIVCSRDKAMAPAYQRRRAEMLGEYVVLETDHSLFYTATKPLVDRLDELAKRLAVVEPLDAS